MLREIGIREFKNRAPEVLRKVREDLCEYVITRRGRPVAILRPFSDGDSEELRQARRQEGLRKMQSLAAEVTANWTSSKSGVDLVSEQRR
jgi:prevent-host-death family protein